jgi:hypothetical protein
VNTYRAHIFKERNVGEREEVKLKIFGPDGSPIDLTGVGGNGGGGGDSETMSFVGAMQPEGDIDHETIAILPFNMAQNLQVEGFELGQGDDPSLYVPAGVYLTKIQATWEWSETPVEGSMRTEIRYMEPAPDSMNVFLYSALYNTVGIGDAQLHQYCQGSKLDVVVLPEDGPIQCVVERWVETMLQSIGVHITVIKL